MVGLFGSPISVRGQKGPLPDRGGSSLKLKGTTWRGGTKNMTESEHVGGTQKFLECFQENSLVFSTE